MAGIEEYAEKMEVKKIVVTMILTALGFVIAFQWRDVIKETIEMFIPGGEGLIYKWIAAILFTILGAIIAIVLIKVQKMDIIPDKYESKLKEKMRKKLKRK